VDDIEPEHLNSSGVNVNESLCNEKAGIAVDDLAQD